MEKLDDVVLEHIISYLPVSALAAAQAVCTHWAELLTSRQLWKPHAVRKSAALSNASSEAVAHDVLHDQQVDWRHLCLERFARQKWRNGKLVHLATLQGHTGAINCVATKDYVIITGSEDHTARVWTIPKQQGLCGSNHKQQHQQHQYQHPRQQQHQHQQQQQQQYVLRHAGPVVAVALPSIDLCVTATADKAYLWRRGSVIRSFSVMPGGRITCMALTDTELLLGTTAGTLQQFDLYSGTQQLITRFERAVTALLPQQQQQQQQHGIEAGDWSVIVGLADGQVICSSCSTGQQLWKLPNRYPARVIGLNITEYSQQQQQQQCSQQQQQPKALMQQKQARKCKHHQDQAVLLAQGRQQQQQQQENMLLVLNSRSQLISWMSPEPQAGSSSSSSSVEVNPDRSSLWPLAVCSLHDRQPGAVRSTAAAAGSSTCMVCPEFGSSCVFVGSSDGSIAVVDVGGCTGSSSSSSSRGSGAGSVGDSVRDPAVSDRAMGAATPPAHAHSGAHNLQQDSLQRTVDAGHSGHDQDTQQQQQQQQQQQHKTVITQSVSCETGLGLQVVRTCSLQKLSSTLAQRQAATASMINSHTVADHQHDEHSTDRLTKKGRSISKLVVFDAERPLNSNSIDVGVNCIVFTGAGQLLVGLRSGYVCLLRFKQAVQLL